MTYSGLSSQSCPVQLTQSIQSTNQAYTIHAAIEPCSHFAMVPATVLQATNISDKAKLVYAHLVSLASENKNLRLLRAVETLVCQKIDANYVKSNLGDIVKDTDLSKFIL